MAQFYEAEMHLLKNLLILLRFLLQYVGARRDDKGKKSVHTLTHRVYAPEGGRGGGAAVQTCQKLLLGDDYNGVELLYYFYESNKYYELFGNELRDLWGAAYFSLTKAKGERGKVYITHDYGSAFGLAILRKKFVYIAHLQGPRVQEKLDYGERFSWVSAQIIRFCERFVFARAFYVCFPSAGARQHYFDSKFRGGSERFVSFGPVLYNTVYFTPEPRIVEGMERAPEITTFLTIGSLTRAKGVDQLPMFFSKLLQKDSSKIRCLLVGTGVLGETLVPQMEDLAAIYENFEFKHYDSLAYDQVQHLMDVTDFYLALHRISICDFATLEAMKSGKPVILSPIGFNLELDKCENIIFADVNNDLPLVDWQKAEVFGEKNKKVYEKYFSNDQFCERYRSMIDDIVR